MAVSKVERSQLIVENLSDVVGNKSEMSREKIRSQFRHFPTWQICVPAVMEGIVVTNRFWQRLKQVRCFNQGFNVTVSVAIEDNSGLG